MIIRPKTHRSGFTLVELAIVLAVTAVLFTGVYRLLTSGNQQVKDSATATQQSQLISAVKTFLSSQPGQNYLATIVCPGGTCSPSNLTLPSTGAGTGACAALFGGNTPMQNEWCSDLPSGFSTATVNSYGQTYQIGVLANTAPPSGSAPTAYSFMILTTGGSVIPDTDGGRISSLIGADGGFVYTNNAGCNVAALWACGAYGAWTANPTTFFPPGLVVTAGTVASRTYISVDQEANLPWLAREVVPGDTATPPVFNTLVTATDLFLNKTGTGQGLNVLYGTGDNKYVSSSSYGGDIFGINEAIFGNNDSTATPQADAESPSVQLNGPVDTSFPIPYPPCIASTAKVTAGSNGQNNATTTFTTSNGANCHAVLQVNGNQATTGMVQANILWASSFIYGATGSDIRIKKDIKPLGDALADVMKLKPVTFRLKQDNRAQIGFIAQDIQKVYPQMVISRPDMILGVDYMQMFAPLVSSVQELKKENDQLRRQLKAQAAEIKELQKHALDSQ